MHTYVFIFVEGKQVHTVSISADTLTMAYDKVLNKRELKTSTLKMVYVIA
jgi:hypothetical protein